MITFLLAFYGLLAILVNQTENEYTFLNAESAKMEQNKWPDQGILGILVISCKMALLPKTLEFYLFIHNVHPWTHFLNFAN